jgi:hypothetical protein
MLSVIGLWIRLQMKSSLKDWANQNHQQLKIKEEDDCIFSSEIVDRELKKDFGHFWRFQKYQDNVSLLVE